MLHRGHVGEEREGTLGQVSPWGSREEGIPLEYHEVTVGEGRKSSGMGLVPGWLGLACSLPSLSVSSLGPPPSSPESWLMSSQESRFSLGCLGAWGPPRTGSETHGPWWPRERACVSTSKDRGKAFQVGKGSGHAVPAQPHGVLPR